MLPLLNIRVFEIQFNEKSFFLFVWSLLYDSTTWTWLHFRFCLYNIFYIFHFSLFTYLTLNQKMDPHFSGNFRNIALIQYLRIKPWMSSLTTLISQVEPTLHGSIDFSNSWNKVIKTAEIYLGKSKLWRQRCVFTCVGPCCCRCRQIQMQIKAFPCP